MKQRLTAVFLSFALMLQTTLGTYSHLYPHKQGELAQMLDSMQKP